MLVEFELWKDYFIEWKSILYRLAFGGGREDYIELEYVHIVIFVVVYINSVLVHVNVYKCKH